MQPPFVQAHHTMAGGKRGEDRRPVATDAQWRKRRRTDDWTEAPVEAGRMEGRAEVAHGIESAEERWGRRAEEARRVDADPPAERSMGQDVTSDGVGCDDVNEAGLLCNEPTVSLSPLAVATIDRKSVV